MSSYHPIAIAMRTSRRFAFVPSAQRSSRNDLLGYHIEARERARAKRGDNCNVCCIASARHQNTSDARRVMAGIEGVPPPAEISFEPGTEIHWRWIARHADVAEIAR